MAFEPKYILIASLLIIAVGFALWAHTRADHATNVMYAVEQRDVIAVKAATVLKRGMEQRDESGDTPFLKAIDSGQYIIAEIIMNAGADIWAIDEFGLTAMHSLKVNPPPTGTAEGDACRRLMHELSARGFPDPLPSNTEILKMKEDGRWPPQIIK